MKTTVLVELRSISTGAWPNSWMIASKNKFPQSSKQGWEMTQSSIQSTISFRGVKIKLPVFEHRRNENEKMGFLLFQHYATLTTNLWFFAPNNSKNKRRFRHPPQFEIVVFSALTNKKLLRPTLGALSDESAKFFDVWCFRTKKIFNTWQQSVGSQEHEKIWCFVTLSSVYIVIIFVCNPDELRLEKPKFAGYRTIPTEAWCHVAFRSVKFLC